MIMAEKDKPLIRPSATFSQWEKAKRNDAHLGPRSYSLSLWERVGVRGLRYACEGRMIMAEKDKPLIRPSATFSPREKESLPGNRDCQRCRAFLPLPWGEGWGEGLEACV